MAHHPTKGLSSSFSPVSLSPYCFVSLSVTRYWCLSLSLSLLLSLSRSAFSLFSLSLTRRVQWLTSLFSKSGTAHSLNFPVIRCSENPDDKTILRTCKNCKTQIEPSLNHPRACLFHTAHFGGTCFSEPLVASLISPSEFLSFY